MKPLHAETIATPAPRAASASAEWSRALRGAVVLVALCGGLYPAATASFGAMLFPHQATGSLVEIDGRVVGSELLGQPFSAPGYFHGRPSAAGYDPFGAAGSNEAPSNPALRERVAADANAVAAANAVAPGEIPMDLVAASGSGLDPHISRRAAELQVERVARARNLSRETVSAVVAEYVEPPVFGVLGQHRVNVLKLNLALDALVP